MRMWKVDNKTYNVNIGKMGGKIVEIWWAKNEESENKGIENVQIEH